jgi:hypothetical protein
MSLLALIHLHKSPRAYHAGQPPLERDKCSLGIFRDSSRMSVSCMYPLERALRARGNKRAWQPYTIPRAHTTHKSHQARIFRFWHVNDCVHWGRVHRLPSQATYFRLSRHRGLPKSCAMKFQLNCRKVAQTACQTGSMLPVTIQERIHPMLSKTSLVLLQKR